MKIEKLKYNRLRYAQGASIPTEIQAVLEGQPVGRVEALKERTKRSVFIIYSASGSDRPAYFLKYDHPAKLLDKLKSYLRSKVKKEYRITRRLFEMGVPIVEPVCCGCAGARGMFVTKAIPDAVSFGNRWLKIKDDPVDRRAFLQEWRNLLVMMLENNLHHADFHSGNILTVKHDNGFRFFLVDVVDARVCRSFSEREALQSLKIVTDWGHWLTDQELVALLQGLPGVFYLTDAKTIRQRLTAKAVQQFYRRGRRHLRNRIFDKDSLVHIVDETDGTFWINHETELTNSQAREIVDRQRTGCDRMQCDGAVFPDGTVQSRSSVVTDQGRWAVLSYRHTSIWKGRRCSFDVRCWFNLWGLQTAGLSAPQPLALFRGRDGVGVIITEYVEGRPLSDMLAGAGPDDEAFLFQMLYDYLRGLYTWKIVPRQLRPADFIVTADKRLVLVSWDHLTFTRFLGKRHWTYYKELICRGMHQSGAGRFKQWLQTAEKTR